jgi:5'(3')-deoxyribonucleotidase
MSNSLLSPVSRYKKIDPKEFTVYVDMDEVFCEFIQGACNVHSVCYQKLSEWRIENRSWNMVPGVSHLKNETLTDQQFWKPISSLGISFWKNLKPTPWANNLIETLNHVFDTNWYILSSPMLDEACYAGKIHWIKEYFGPKFGHRFILTPHKHLLSKKNTLLIDDNHETLQKFSQQKFTPHPIEKGIGYLFASSPLAYTVDRDDPVSALRSTLLSTFQINPK